MKFIRSKFKSLILSFLGAYTAISLVVVFSHSPQSQAKINAPFLFAPFENLAFASTGDTDAFVPMPGVGDDGKTCYNCPIVITIDDDGEFVIGGQTYKPQSLNSN